MVTQPFQFVRLDPVKSAEPPKNSGRNGANALITFCDDLRVATGSVTAAAAAIAASAFAAKSAGGAPETRRRNSAASAGKARAYSAKPASHSAWRCAPAARASQAARISAGTSNGGK